MRCKHIYAVEYMLDGIEDAEPEPQPQPVRVTYRQKWPEYNAAQTTEKATFQRLLHDLCSDIPEPPQTLGRRPLPLSDMVFSAAFKVYTTSQAAAS